MKNLSIHANPTALPTYINLDSNMHDMYLWKAPVHTISARYAVSQGRHPAAAVPTI